MRGLQALGIILPLALVAAAPLGLRAAAPAHGAHAGSAPKGVSPAMTVERLIAGNQRFVAGKPIGLRRDPTRRAELAQGQRPPAVIVGCSDSRVPANLVFDQGLGELFITRLAGNIVDDAVIGSIEYAVDHLHARLIVVLGHDRCGAVEAALKGGSVPGHMGSFVEAIRPAVEEARSQPGDPLQNAVNANVRRMVHLLRTSQPILASGVKSGRLKVVGARYDLESGKVVWLP
jgi:carbonic anhydrase